MDDDAGKQAGSVPDKSAVSLMKASSDRYTGCLLGLALGDALGAPYEGGPLERALWWVLGRTAEGLPRWTDDTSMSLDLADSLLACGRLDLDDLASRFAASYRWSRGYGPSTARLLRRIQRGQPWQDAARADHPGGSFGNGGAMRAAVMALYVPLDSPHMVELSKEQARVTHSHRLGQAGAVLIALSVQSMLRRLDLSQTMALLERHVTAQELVPQLKLAKTWLLGGQVPAPRELARRLGNGMTVQTSCVTATVLGLGYLERSFEELLLSARRCGGDVDTIGAIAGAIWGARRGAQALPATPIEARERIIATAEALARAFDPEGAA
jgi:ADP-ribosylglycohydrolase